MDTLDLRGMSCPIPVIETKKLLDAKAVNEIEIHLDDETARENVSRFLATRGFSVSAERKAGDATITLHGTKTGEPVSESAPVEVVCGTTGKLLVYIGSETIGVGDDTLGRVLMNSFLHTIKELDQIPWRILFINGGVKLVAQGSEHIDILRELSGLGSEILACGTCLDFFRLKDKVEVGSVTNMHEIASSFLQAAHVIRP